jgi:hypothetical protein
MEALQKEFDFYRKHQKDLVKDHEGRYLVIKNQSVIGVYGTREEAIQESMKEHKLGTFLVQYVQSGDKSISQTFHSRVIFSAN